ncbi:MAG TPA: Tim44/TimA family putative adaptor protein [Geminicoccaceae bacterium]|nr:Tim44/TimA family putative adaptor protein [Geminicoccaceae bacterium]
MSDGFAYIDILFFAMVAAFIALRLRSVLGRRTGQERRRTGGFMGPSRANGAADGKGASDNVVALPDRSTPPPDAIADLAEGGVKAGLTQIRLADASFDLTKFLGGARAAFEMIVHAYAVGDKDALRPLLADGVFAGFAGAIDQRHADGQTLDTQLMAIEQAEVVDAGMHGDMARVSVRFTSEQVNVVRDADGREVEGNSNTAERVVDIWTFERDTRSSDPNWTLIETRTPS